MQGFIVCWVQSSIVQFYDEILSLNERAKVANPETCLDFIQEFRKPKMRFLAKKRQGS